MLWQFDNALPIYTQLVDQIKLAIVSGELPLGSRMSTFRDLAREAGVNPNTMQRALQQLEREGLVFTQRSSGRFVTEDVAVIDSVKEALAKEHAGRFLSAMHSLGYSQAQIMRLLEGSLKEENNGVSS